MQTADNLARVVEEPKPRLLFASGHYSISVDGTTPDSRANWRGPFFVSFRGGLVRRNGILLESDRFLGVFNVSADFETIWILPRFALNIETVKVTHKASDTLFVYRFSAKPERSLIQLRRSEEIVQLPRKE